VTQTAKLCLPIIGKNFQEILDSIQTSQPLVENLEIRFDYLENPQVDFVDQILPAVDQSKKVIFTFRPKKEGGEFVGEIHFWQEIIQKALTVGFDFVDIDFANIGLIDFTEKHPKTKIICSYHHFNTTPGYRNLRKLQKRMRGYKPDIMKFATKVKTDEDNQNLLRLLLSKKKNEKMIVVGMGEKGKIIRFVAPLLGSQIAWVTHKNISSAPGQLSLQDTQNLYLVLQNAGVINDKKFSEN
jgi:3-dehydroquinate dehydratase type I